MTLEQTQKKVGVETEDSRNVEPKTGRSDGFDGAQDRVGYMGEDSPPVGRPGGEFPGETQGSTGYESEDSQPTKENKSGRIDKVKEI